MAMLVSAAAGQEAPLQGRAFTPVTSAPNDFQRAATAAAKRSGVKSGVPRAKSSLSAEQALRTPPAAAFASATGGERNADMPGCRVDPSSPSIGADVPLTYFGAAPSSVNPSFIGRLQLLTAGQLDERMGTIELPLYQGRMAGSGETVWYILTDTTDQGNAQALGLNFSPKLNYAATGRGVRNATLLRGGVLEFESGRVDFAPERRVVPGPATAPFPPAEAVPGSVGDRNYTPLVRITNAGGHIYNAPIVAFNATPAQILAGGRVNRNVVHDKVVAVDFVRRTVTLSLTPGFSFARPVLYLSMEASAPLVAAMEGATVAPGMTDIETGDDDSAFSAVERIFVMVNGQRGCDNPQRQGLEAALTDGGAPMNMLGGIPTIATDYSPLWDMNLGEWTAAARTRNVPSRMIEEFQLLSFVEAGMITGPGGARYGSIGIIVNCPIVFRFL